MTVKLTNFTLSPDGNRVTGPLSEIDLELFHDTANIYTFDADEIAKEGNRFVFYRQGRRIGSVKQHCVKSMNTWKVLEPVRHLVGKRPLPLIEDRV